MPFKARDPVMLHRVYIYLHLYYGKTRNNCNKCRLNRRIDKQKDIATAQSLFFRHEFNNLN